MRQFFIRIIFTICVSVISINISNKDIISDNKMIMEFMNARNAEGAKSAMRIHILRAINQLKLEK